ncbi:NUMOD4 domain-containing protein [Enterococcus faecalis]|uniref:HNH homing endonuclease n=1 Tax=Enterococcus phage vB_EfaS_IME196 TaxID=1747289 RepID=A0A0S2MY63_9CAUD|nr:NUMOD4 domain-containing protein [Enterococcus faecalis]YP_009216610.1 HNH endonuclease [Enterococcus phage vB_EfaS_IME196]ALO80891.1 HNH homing endonuclease [Enterococcus phage vB_EfaS_IME196]MCH1677439.1 NUMOD4 motif-containing HNH endonuclease [Enterococcus faecalis]MCH1680231.1 NUMOD4 motif-containing HNH endonuclease [Enterococcus faecalis]
MEKWKDIVEYEGLYQVSNLGNVYSFKTNKYLKPSGDKYLHVILSKNNRTKTVRIHRLVAEAFIPNQDNKPQVNHIDGDRYNNNVKNLEWLTCKENIVHAYDYLGKVASTTNAHNSNKVRCEVIEKSNGNSIIFDSIKEAENYYGVHTNTFSRAITKQNGKMRKYNIRKLD